MSDATLTARRLRRRPKLAESKVLRRRDVTDDLWAVWIEKPAGFSFKPGQYCTIGVDGIERAYSIVSAPHEDDLELFVELVPPPDGVLTPKLWELGPGDTVTIRPRAKGIFVFKPALPNHLLVSTVTGVVPYVSILRDYVHHGRSGHRFHVLQGASYADEFTYDGELSDLAEAPPRPGLVRTDREPSRRGAQRRLAGREGPRQRDRRGLRRGDGADARRHNRLRLRPSGYDRGREGPLHPARFPGRGRAILEGRLTGPAGRPAARA